MCPRGEERQKQAFFSSSAFSSFSAHTTHDDEWVRMLAEA